MFGLKHARDRNCRGVSRRELLRVGAVTAAGLSLPDLFRLRAAQASSAAPQPPRPPNFGGSGSGSQDVNCIFFFLWGGPSQYETFDPKPDAPSEIRGPFKAISTSVEGLQLCEHLPTLAKMAHRFATIRNLHHENNQHPDSGSFAQAGQFPVKGQRFPNHGSVIARFGSPSKGVLPPFVRVGPDLWDSAGEITAQDGGFLGGAYAPFIIPDPRESLDKIATLAPPAGLTPGRLSRRKALHEQLDDFQRAVESSSTVSHDAAYERAFALVTSLEAKKALDLSCEPRKVRERYGNTLPGQGALMARRLIEAGVRFAQVNWCRVVIQQGWDTHGTGTGGTIEQMKDFLLPALDQSVSALFEDLEQRGLHHNTLVVVVGEFGRTHKLNRKAGRDHWSGVYPALMFGHGIPGGLVVGKSDDAGMYPDGPHCTPEDVSMTIYRLMGLDISHTLRQPNIVKAAPGIPGIGS
jgi:uncharacterized protein DUF1501